MRGTTMAALALLVGCGGDAPPDGELAARVDALESALAEAQVTIDALTEGTPTSPALASEVAGLADDLADLEGRVDTLEGGGAATQDWVTAQLEDYATEAWVTDALADVATTGDLASLEADAVRLVTEDLFLDVPGDHDTIGEALAALDGWLLAADVTATILVADGTHDQTETLRVAHPSGDRIRIVGNTDDPSTVVLSFPEGVSGLQITNNNTLGWIDGVTLRGAGAESDWANGVLALNGARAALGSEVVVEDFAGHGMVVSRGASVLASGVEVRNNGGMGFLTYSASSLVAWNSRSEGNGGDGYRVSLASSGEFFQATSEGNGDNGFAAYLGGTVEGWQMTAEGNDSAGFNAWGNASLLAGEAEALSNLGDGFSAGRTSSIASDNALAQQNSGNGFAARKGSTVSSYGATAHDNDGDGFHAWGNGLLNTSAGTATENKGHGFAVFSGSNVNADQSESSDNDGDGYHASERALLGVAGALAERNDRGFNVGSGSALHAWGNADQVTQALDNRSHGFGVHNGSLLVGDSFDAKYNGDDGFHGGTGSVLDVGSLEVSQNDHSGLAIHQGAHLSATDAWVENNGDHGVILTLSSAHLRGSFVDNGGYGIAGWDASRVDADHTTVTGNTGGSLTTNHGGTVIADEVTAPAGAHPEPHDQNDRYAQIYAPSLVD